MTVQGHNGKLVGIRGKLDAGDIAVFIKRKVHLTGHAAFDIKRMYGYFRIDFARLRIFISIGTRISGVIRALGRHSFIPREVEHRHFAFVETDVGNHFAIGTEIKGAVEAEFFFIYPIGNAVQHLVVFSVLSDLRFAIAKEQFYKEDVIVAHKSDLESVGREEGHLLRPVLRERFYRVVSHIINIIFRRERTPVNGFRLGLDENQFLVGRHDVIIECLDRAIACGFYIEDSFYLLSGLERIFHNPFPVGTDLCVMFSVQHRFNAINVLRAVCSVCHILKRHVLLCKSAHKRQEHAA